MIRLSIESLPWKIQATRSNWNRPTSPQFNEPIMESAKQILSNIISTPLSLLFLTQKKEFIQKTRQKFAVF